MDDPETRLAKSLSRLLAATTRLKGPAPRSIDDADLADAREEAAKLLLQRRAQHGRPWKLSTELPSFFERWVRLRSDAGEHGTKAGS